MDNFIDILGIKIGNPKLFFACKLTQAGRTHRAAASEKLASSTMSNACKLLIVAARLDPTTYATHSSKRGGALESMKKGLSNIQIQELGRWSRASMVSRYVRGSNDVCDNLAEASRI
jgi:hypothetical protein